MSEREGGERATLNGCQNGGGHYVQTLWWLTRTSTQSPYACGNVQVAVPSVYSGEIQPLIERT